MTSYSKRSVKSIVITLALLLPGLVLSAAGPAPVDLGAAAHFVILGASEITVAAGSSIVTGDVGLSPAGGAFIGVTDAQVNGIIYKTDAGGPLGAGVVVDPLLLGVAKDALDTAYYDAQNRLLPTAIDPGAGELGSANLSPGLYKFTTTAYISTGNLTLTGTGDPNDVWIFQIGTGLTVGDSGIQVILANGAQARNVFWQVGSSATIGAAAVFKGTILADQSITLNATSVLEGRALARIGQVTFNGTSSILPPPNHAPDGADHTVTMDEDTAYGFVVSDFGFTDLNDEPTPNTLLAIKITTVPLAGSLKLGFAMVNAGTFVAVADIPFLTFNPVANANGVAYASFTFQVQDDGGSLNGGVDLDQTPNTMTINVTAVNDAPIALNDAYAATQGGTLSPATPGVLGNDTDAEGSALSALLVSGPAHGALKIGRASCRERV